MKKKTAWILVLSLLLTLLVGTIPAFADTVTDSYAEGDVDASVFLAGQNPQNQANVKGLACLAGYNVESSGLSEYLIGAGYNVVASGETEKDAVLAAYGIALSGNIGRDVYAAAKDINLSGTVGRNAYLAASAVTVSGKVYGNLHIDAEKILISENAVIEGTLRYNENADIVAPQAVLAVSDRYEVDLPDSEPSEDVDEKPSTGNKILMSVKSVLFSYVGVLIVALVLLWLTSLWECVDKKYTAVTFGKYAAAFGIGFAVLVALPIAALVFMLTGFGTRFGLTLLMLYVAAIAVSPVFISFFVGRLICRKAFKKNTCYPAELALGILAWRIVACIPGLSFILGFVSVPFGIGVLTLLLGKKKTPGPEDEVPTALAEASSETAPNE